VLTLEDCCDAKCDVYSRKEQREPGGGLAGSYPAGKWGEILREGESTWAWGVF